MQITLPFVFFLPTVPHVHVYIYIIYIWAWIKGFISCWQLVEIVIL